MSSPTGQSLVTHRSVHRDSLGSHAPARVVEPQVSRLWRLRIAMLPGAAKGRMRSTHVLPPANHWYSLQDSICCSVQGVTPLPKRS